MAMTAGVRRGRMGGAEGGGPPTGPRRETRAGRRQPPGTCGVLAVPLLLLGCEQAGGRVERFTGDEIWFTDLGERTVPATELQERWVRSAHRALLTGEPVYWAPEDPADSAPRITFLSVSDGRSRADVFAGTGRGWRQALEHAVEGARASRRLPTDSLRLKLDLVAAAREEIEAEPRSYLRIDRTLEGAAFPRVTRLAFLPEELVSGTLVGRDSRLRLDNIRLWDVPVGAAPRANLLVGDLAEAVRPFATVGTYFDGDTVLHLYRGHAVRWEPTAEELREAARRGGAYLTRAVDERGRFAYSYFPKSDRVSDDYNMVRHAGTVYSMLDLWRETREPELREAAERAIGYMLRYVEPFTGPGDSTLVLTYADRIKLGGVALAILALVEHVRATGDSTHLAVAQGLGRYIAESQRPDGRFVHQRTAATREVRDFVSQYYPGEALFALGRLYLVDGQEAWLDVAEKGARYLIEVRDGGLSAAELTPDHWLLYALNELHRHRPRQLYLNQAMRITEAIRGQQRRSPQPSDWVGSYNFPPRSTPAATRAEGLLAAHLLARDFGREEAEGILETARLTVAFQLLTEMRPERALYLPDPRRALGGFTASLDNFEIRIDYVQHNVSALIALYRVLAESESR